MYAIALKSLFSDEFRTVSFGGTGIAHCNLGVNTVSRSGRVCSVKHVDDNQAPGAGARYYNGPRMCSLWEIRDWR